MKNIKWTFLLTGILVSQAWAEAPEPVLAGNGQAKLNGLLQFWTLNDTTASTDRFNFRLRRAEIQFVGSVQENTRWFLMADAAKALTVSSTGTLSSADDNRILQDLGVAYTFFPGLEIIGGQFKIPTTAEGLDPTSEMIFAERSYTARFFGTRREPGVMGVYKFPLGKVSAMISNGQKTNSDDVNNRKDLSVRADLKPLESVSVGAFTTAGDYNYSTRSRFGINAKATIEAFLFRVEAVKGKELGLINTGWVATTTYGINEKLQAAASYENFKTGVFHSNAENLGLNYFLKAHSSKIQLNATRLNRMTGSNGTYVPANGIQGNMVTLVFQAAI